MAQNYETNISLICRKSTDNWIDPLISFTVLTQCTISTWICQNESLILSVRQILLQISQCGLHEKSCDLKL